MVAEDDVMIDPLGDQAARLIDRGFGMMDAIEGRAGAEGFEIPIAMNSQLAIRGDDSALTTASDRAELAPHPAKAPVCPAGRSISAMRRFIQGGP
jgi:hypothetical protein